MIITDTETLYPWLSEEVKSCIQDFQPKPFYTFLLKIASHCNLNCKYCYMYNLADQTWVQQPKTMSDQTILQTAKRIKDHAIAHNLSDVRIIFHGGEPLLVGIDYLRKVIEFINKSLQPVKVSYGIQSNGILLKKEWIELLSAYQIGIGISIDGDKELNDTNRVYHNGRGTHDDLIKSLNLLQDAKEKVNYGFLCVIDTNTDPIKVYDYLLSFEPKQIDFLLPLNHYDSLPQGKATVSPLDTRYADWLIPIFDKWYNSQSLTAIRYFTDIISLILGAENSVETLGLGVVDFVIIETNGDIEAVDSLKSTYERATGLGGLNVATHSFDEALAHPAIFSRQLGINSLCQTCQQCSIVNVCGGGYLPHRYSSKNGFMNPSVYCEDLKKLILHIYDVIQNDIQKIS